MPRLRMEIFKSCRPFAPETCGRILYGCHQQITVKKELSHAGQTKLDMDINLTALVILMGLVLTGLVMAARPQLGWEYVT